MKKMVRQGIHDLLDRVLDASLEESWAVFRFTRYTNCRPELEVAFGGNEYAERRTASELGEVVARAKAATDE